MIWFWIVAGLLILVALIALLRPLLRAPAGSTDPDESVVAMFRRQLANIDTEVEQGRLTAEQAAETRADLTRRMLAAADRESRDPALAKGRPAETSWRLGAAVGIAGLIPASALAIYFTVGAPAAINPAAAISAASGAAGRHDAVPLVAAAEQLKARLEREPEHVEGWILLGRTFTSLGRFADARDAYRQAIALAPNEIGLHAELGELLVLGAGGSVTPDAAAEFAKAGNDPRARFYAAEAALQRGDSTEAKSTLRALLADAPADAPWRKIVAQRLAEIAPDEPQGTPKAVGAAPGAPTAGPTAQDVAAAQAMSPDERQAMIRGMVDRLAARLEQNPNDKDGWIRLAHAYDVLGETEKAQAARARAAAAPPAASSGK